MKGNRKPQQGRQYYLVACLLLLGVLITVNMWSSKELIEEDVKRIEPVRSDSDDSATNEEYPLGQLTGDEEKGISTEDSFSSGEQNDNNVDVGDVESLSTAIDTAATTKSDSSEQDDAFSAVLDDLGGFLFSDGEFYEQAPVVTVPDARVLTASERKGIWKLLPLHEKFFQEHPHKRYIPHLQQEISKEQFHQTFRLTSTAVVIPFDKMRHLGFTTRAWTIEQLQERFPFNPATDKQVMYTPRGGSFVELGPAVYALSKNEPLKKEKGHRRNFPRNMMVAPKYLEKLGVTPPPFVDKRRFQVPTMWFGTETSDTKFHHDCCDNFVMMISGTKRWYIAPPSDAAHLRPIKCEGSKQSLCWASVKYPNKKDLNVREQGKLDKLASIVVDLKAGEMLYLPAGWWHHIENLGPTVMVNWWTMGCENSAVALAADPQRKDRPDFAGKCPAVQKASELFRST